VVAYAARCSICLSKALSGFSSGTCLTISSSWCLILAWIPSEVRTALIIFSAACSQW
jgi:hypothetical protein